jgi:HSP20 family protein
MFGLQPYTPKRGSLPTVFDVWSDRNLLLPNDVISGQWSASYGAADLFETDDAVIVQLMAPGFKAEDIFVQEQGGVLTIRAEEQAERRGERDGVQFEVQRAYFLQRSFRLPVEVDADRAEATLRDGVLTITLPKVQTRGAYRITIQPGKQLITVRSRAQNWFERLTSWLRRPRARLIRKAA